MEWVLLIAIWSTPDKKLLTHIIQPMTNVSIEEFCRLDEDGSHRPRRRSLNNDNLGETKVNTACFYRDEIFNPLKSRAQLSFDKIRRVE